MAKVTTTVIVSDVSGAEVPEDEGTTVRFTNGDKLYSFDATLPEVEKLFKGIEMQVSNRPGRKSASENGGSEKDAAADSGK